MKRTGVPSAIDTHSRVTSTLWLLTYLAAWLPVTAMYFIGFAAGPGGSLSAAAWYAVANCALSATLALWLWPMAKRIQSEHLARWRHRLGAAIAVLLLATAHAAVWGLGLRLTGVDTDTVVDAVAWDAFGGLWLFSLVLVAMTMVHSMRRAREQDWALRTAVGEAHRADALRAQAELRTIRSHLNPHFLFNALNSISAVVQRDPATARAMLVRTGTLLRRVLELGGRADHLVTVDEEWRLVRDYLDIEQLRMQGRLRVHAELSEEARECLLPALTLQPLVENAVRHGIFPKLGASTLQILAVVRDRQLRIDVRDDGIGVTPPSAGGFGSGMGSGQRAVLERLQGAFGTDASMQIASGTGGGYHVALRMPVHAGEL
jgi:hypothetical protein